MEQRRPGVRVVVVAGVALLWMVAVLGRLSYLQLVRYADFLARAQRQQQRLVEISPRRGELYDRNRRELAMSINVDSCFAVPGEITDPGMVARLLAGVLGTPSEEMETRLKASRSFVWVARKLPPEVSERIAALNLRGVYFQKESRRFYPKRELAAHTLGYVDIDERGLGGIEQSLDSAIRSKPGRLLILADAKRRWYDRAEKAPGAGARVVLTLDEKIQFIAERELDEAVRTTHAQAGSIVVQDPASGELLALANWPTFNPNTPGESPAEARMNRAITALYEPGSTFKIVTLAAALEEGLTRPEEIIDCQMGAIYIAGQRIRDHKPFGLLSVAQVLAKSSDVGAIKIGLRLGAPKLYDYIRAFGFGTETRIELPGESRGLVRRVESWTPLSVGSISMGQEVGITSVQLASAMSTIANGGLLYSPRLVHEIRQGERVVPGSGTAPRRVISPTTAATLRQLLEGVILDGTGTLARLDGYTAAGKTGTAQKIDPATGRYSLTQHIASFVGFAPVNNPAVTVLISLDSPAGLYHGGDVAAPVFKRVAEAVLAYLDVPHDVVVSARRPRVEWARTTKLPDVSDFDPVQTESAMSTGAVPALLQEPSAVPAGGALQTVALVDGEGLAVPAFTGKTVRTVSEECSKLGLNPVLIGTGIAVQQIPEAGARIRRGGRVTVRFARAG